MCKYHMVFIPKYIGKIIYHKSRNDLSEIIESLHVHMLLVIPQKMSISDFMGYLKVKSTMMLFESHDNLKYNLGNKKLGATGIM